jgi:ankyrin repeat protein
MTRRSQLLAALTALFVLAGACSKSTAAPQAAPVPPDVVELSQQDANIWAHTLPPMTAVHVGEGNPSLRGFEDYVSFDIVVSKQGRVESATLVGNEPKHVEEARAAEMARHFKPWTRNGQPIRVKVRDFVSLLPPEKWGPIPHRFPKPWSLADAEVTLSRTGCFGACPAYSVSIAGDGTVRFNGQLFVLIPGEHVAKISPDRVRDLIGKFESANFFSARDEYVSRVTDNPTQTLVLKVAGQTKTVVDYVGLRAGLPLVIKDLEDQVDEAADTGCWVNGDDQTVRSLKAEKWPFTSPAAANLAVYSSAIHNKFTPLIDAYVTAGGPAFSPEGRDVSPVCTASGTGNLALVQRMLKPKSGTKPAAIPAQVKNDCLSDAAVGGNAELVKFWLDLGADVNAKPVRHNPMDRGLSALASGVASCNPAVVSALLKHKPDLHAVINEDPILTFAVEAGRIEDGDRKAEIVGLLIKAGADPNARGHFDQTPLFATNFAPQAIKPLVAAGSSVDARDQSGNTPLIWTAYSEPAVRALLEAGANPDVHDNQGDTPLKRASSCRPCQGLIQEALKKRAQSAPPKKP